MDYILVKQNFEYQVRDYKSYRGADVDSEYNSIIIKCSLKFKTTKKCQGQISSDQIWPGLVKLNRASESKRQTNFFLGC